MHDRTADTLAAVDAFAVETTERTPPQLAKLAAYANREGRFAPYEVDMIRVDAGQAESAIMRGQRLGDDLRAAREAMLDAGLRAGRMGFDDGHLVAAIDKLNAALQPWRSIEMGMRAQVAMAQAVGWN